MTTKEMTYQYRLARWSDLTKERAELGLSIRAYCAMKGFAENTYFYWQRRLREAVRTQLETEQASLPVPGFVEVALAPAPETPVRQAQGGQLQVQINGIHLSADSRNQQEAAQPCGLLPLLVWGKFGGAYVSVKATSTYETGCNVW